MRINEEKLSENSIQNALFRKFGMSSRMMIPNWQKPGWSECDMFRVTKSGYGIEYEIKLSRSDFKADCKKVVSRRRFGRVPKHELLADGDTLGPSRFFFVSPCDLIDEGDLPKWAGLITVSLWTPKHGYSGTPRIEEPKIIKAAPKLHGEKVSEVALEKGRVTMGWRYWQGRGAA